MGLITVGDDVSRAGVTSPMIKGAPTKGRQCRGFRSDVEIATRAHDGFALGQAGCAECVAHSREDGLSIAADAAPSRVTPSRGRDDKLVFLRAAGIP
jgi:hypothetical protein